MFSVVPDVCELSRWRAGEGGGGGGVGGGEKWGGVMWGRDCEEEDVEGVMISLLVSMVHVSTQRNDAGY